MLEISNILFYQKVENRIKYYQNIHVVEELYEPMIHMIRNSVDHGLETPAEMEAVVLFLLIGGFCSVQNISFPANIPPGIQGMEAF